jgi:hypothetical protein
MDDLKPVPDTIFQVCASPIISSPAHTKRSIFKGYTIAPNTLVADISRFFLDILIHNDTLSKSTHYCDAVERLTWLAAADVKYFIVPDATREIILTGDEEENKKVAFIPSSRLAEIYNYDEDEI